MRFDPEFWKELSRTDFEGAWHRGPEVLSRPSLAATYPRKGFRRAAPHPIAETIQRLREVYLSMGFDEARVPLMIEEADVYRQFGPEASAVLDRVFYLGGLPRPNVGISDRQAEEIMGIIRAENDSYAVPPEEVKEKLQQTFHAYKKATIDGDELSHEIAADLGIDDALVVHILDSIFPEFRDLAPESSRTTLRSHMTSGWFLSLGAMWEHYPRPICLFSIDRCFRREQEEGPTRLMTYHSASCVLAGEEITIEDGKAVSEALLSAFGFEDFEFRPDEKRSKYYIPDTQTEVYARHPEIGWVEVATFGMYSPSALGEYGIGVPVMNLGLGVERLAMILYQADDVRKLTHPQFFPRTLTDREIAAAITLREEAQSPEGRALVEAIMATATANAAAEGPCSFLAFEGEVGGRRLRVFVEEPEENSRLCGPATFNEVFVQDGRVLGVPDTEKFADVRANGAPTGISYLMAAANLAAARIEEAARCGEAASVQVKMAKTPSDVNLRIPDWTMRYITDNKRKVDVRGPVFLTVRGEIGE
ncbi:O-phosphoserine--tRNA ligase [Methanofollis fontis]|uniref:O-phosphoserine--tRNA(Cys) ligase n=1 Tax=Methanofollis fontis TaxID=2052832 RepID=A0A483CZC4_9EURY|nr:O-phosphoserine--tRNA ligase [Methanofollis fontis]TAJ45692.1 O-phosphoserine--tRNA ligase [Methanofollis fontis]